MIVSVKRCRFFKAPNVNVSEAMFCADMFACVMRVCRRYASMREPGSSVSQTGIAVLVGQGRREFCRARLGVFLAGALTASDAGGRDFVGSRRRSQCP